MLTWLIVGGLTILFSYWMVSRLRLWIAQRNILDIPNERSSHSQPIPRGGGLAIVVITLAFWLVYAWLKGIAQVNFWLLWIGALIVAVTGWLDDVYSLSSKLRLGIHGIVAILGVVGVGAWNSVAIPVLGTLSLGWLGFPLTILWIIGMINAYNFMDGIDGIAGSQAVVAGTGWFILGMLWDAPVVASLSLVMAASNLGFLMHNWHPASIFMGDVASGFLGYMFAIVPLLQNGNNVRGVTLLSGILFVWPFLFDAIFTFLRRLSHGEQVFTAHRSHLYQRLVIAGKSHRSVTILYIGLALIGLILSLLWYWEIKVSSLAVVFVLPLCCTLLWAFVVYNERKN